LFALFAFRGRIMTHRLRLLVAAALVAALSSVVMAQTFSALRGHTPIDQEGPPPPMTPEQNSSVREPRNYPEQPPVIPHSTAGYEDSINTNKCLSCDARTRIRESQEPMISIRQSLERDRQLQSSDSKRRYGRAEG